MSVGTEISRLENAKAAITTAIAGKGVTVPSGTKLDSMAALIDSIEAGGGGANKLLEWFGGSKYYATTVTPALTTSELTITPDDATILSSPKFLLVTMDIPAARNVARTQAIARIPTRDAYVASVTAFSIGMVCSVVFTQVMSIGGSGNKAYSRIYTAGGDVFTEEHGIPIRDGKTLVVDASKITCTFKGGQPYKVLLIG